MCIRDSEHLHYDDKGQVFIPPMVFKNCLSDAAAYLGIKIKGEGNSKWRKHFEAGIMVVEPLMLGVNKDDVQGEKLFLPADGKPGSGTRVVKRYPVIPKWSGTVNYLIVDDKIHQEIFELHLRQAGQLIGIGRFRPRNRGYYGRFEVKEVVWEDMGAAIPEAA